MELDDAVETKNLSCWPAAERSCTMRSLCGAAGAYRSRMAAISTSSLRLSDSSAAESGEATRCASTHRRSSIR